jgi:hypothetical protein
MTIVYVTTGPWGTGTGAQNSAAQIDGNFYTLAQGLAAVEADLDVGKRIDFVTYTEANMTFTYTDATTQVIPLPIAVMTYVGEWTNSTPLTRLNLFSVNGLGFYQVLQDHITPASPTEFDPNAIDDTTAGNPLYQLWFPLRDINYDAVLFTPGSIQREPDELLFSGIANRAMQLKSGNLGAYAYLDVGNDGTGATDIIISIQKNRVEIGTITFEANGDVDSAGGQPGAFSIPLTTDFAANDVYSLRVTQSDNAEPAGLSITLPFLRMDI